MDNEFTYSFYGEMIQSLINHGYRICSYHDDSEDKKCILRHDIDLDIDKALELATVENKLGVKSTYFVLLRTCFYNPFSKKAIDSLKKIILLGHEIGLHFDEKSYDEGTNIVDKVIEEANILSKGLDYKIRVVSMHRPSRKTLESDYSINGIVNSYSKRFFQDYKYLSDSRRHWKEDVLAIINSDVYPRLHILTHAFWYNDTTIDMRDALLQFVGNANKERYENLADNFSKLEEVYVFETEDNK